VPEWAGAAKKWQGLAGDEAAPPWLVYGGEESYVRQGIRVFSWRNLPALPS